MRVDFEILSRCYLLSTTFRESLPSLFPFVLKLFFCRVPFLPATNRNKHILVVCIFCALLTVLNEQIGLNLTSCPQRLGSWFWAFPIFLGRIWTTWCHPPLPCTSQAWLPCSKHMPARSTEHRSSSASPDTPQRNRTSAAYRQSEIWIVAIIKLDSSSLQNICSKLNEWYIYVGKK